MLFQDLLVELTGGVATAVDELFRAAEENQSHPQDLFLVDQHGFYWKALANLQAHDRHRLSPYVIGTSEIGFAYDTFYKFVDWYRKSHMMDKAAWDEEVAREVEGQEEERLTIRVEQSIYLRFWEADWLLKRYCQLSSLALGQPYNWHLTIPSDPRERKRHEIIRHEIRDRVKRICPNFYALVKENYKTQIRNAIAHSQFSMLGREIHFLNHSPDPKDYAPQRSMSFDAWYRQFHVTLLLHNETIRALSACRKRYESLALAGNNCLEVRVTAPGQSPFFRQVVLHANGCWGWRQNVDDEGPSQQSR